jgi:hypothetical protein
MLVFGVWRRPNSHQIKIIKELSRFPKAAFAFSDQFLNIGYEIACRLIGFLGNFTFHHRLFEQIFKFFNK